MLIACGPAQEPAQNVTALPQVDASVEARDVNAPDARSSTNTIASATPSASASTSVRGPEVIVALMRVGLKHCYNAALKSDPNLRATIKLTIEVAPDGSVTKVTPHSTPPAPSDLEQCLVATASKVAFDPPGGNGATFELPINLVPANP